MNFLRTGAERIGADVQENPATFLKYTILKRLFIGTLESQTITFYEKRSSQGIADSRRASRQPNIIENKIRQIKKRSTKT